MSRQQVADALPRPVPPTGDEARERLIERIPATERRLEVAGVSTAVLEAGDGPPLLVLHGLGQFAATWIRLIPQLAKGRRVVMPDLPGLGASTVTDGRQGADRVLEWLGELIEKTCPSPPALVGHTLGGAIACRFTIDHGNRVRKLVLVDTFGLGPFRPAPKFALAMVGFLVRPTEDTRDRFLGQCMLDFDGVRNEMGEEWKLIARHALEGARTPSVRSGGRSLMKAFGVSPIPAEDLEQIDVPTTLVWGRHDLETRLRVAEAASARHGWPLHVIENCASDPNLEQPEALLGALSRALEDR